MHTDPPQEPPSHARPQTGGASQSPHAITRVSDALRHARKVVVLVVGGTLLLLGVAMLVLPGPGVLGVLLGLALLGTEFAWAKRLLQRARAAMTPRTPKAGGPPSDIDPS